MPSPTLALIRAAVVRFAKADEALNERPYPKWAATCKLINEKDRAEAALLAIGKRLLERAPG